MTWPPQSPDLNPIEMVWDELDHRVKEKQPTSVWYMWELLQDCWKSIPHEAGREIAKCVQNIKNAWSFTLLYKTIFL
jgi:transposase